MSTRLLRFAFLLFSTLLGTRATAQQTQENLWMTDGPVNTLLRANNTLYIGGSFNYVGPRTGSAVPVTAASGTIPAGFPAVDGTVNCILPDGNGGWFIGGFFEQVGTVARRSLAHILPDFSVDPLWNPTGGFTGAGQNRIVVYTLAQSGPLLYVGGSFDRIGSWYRNNLFALTAATGAVTAWAPEPNRTVQTLAVKGSTVYAGGQFTQIGSVNRYMAAAFNTTSGTLQTWAPLTNTGFPLQVFSLAVADNTIFIGGNSVAGSVLTDNLRHLIAVDATTGTRLPGWDYPISSTIRTMLVTGSTLYVGGNLNENSASKPLGVQALSVTTGALASAPAVPAGVNSLAIDGGTLYVGGSFTPATTGPPRSRLAAYALSSGTLLPWAPYTNDQVNALAAQNGTLYVGGEFASAGGLLRSNAAALNLTSGRATAWNPAPNNEVGRLFRVGSQLFLGGKFTRLGSVARTAVAQVDSSLGTPTAWAPQVATGPAEPELQVRAFALHDSILYFGGSFSQVNQQPMPAVAGMHLRTGQLQPYLPCSITQVRDLALSGDTLLIGGEYSSTNYNRLPFETVTLRNRTRINYLSSGTVIPGSFQQLKVVGSRIYVAMISGAVGSGAPAVSPAVFCWDRKTGKLLSWNARIRDGSSVPAQAAALAMVGNKIYVGGRFQAPQGGAASHGLIALDSVTATSSSTWKPLETPYPAVPYLNYSGSLINTLDVGGPGSVLYAGGSFKQINGQLRTGLVGLALAASAAQSISFTPPASLPVNTSFTLTGTASSGLPVRFRVVGGTARATLSGAALTPTTTGTLEVEAYQNGNLAYEGAAPVRRTITISAVNATSSALTPLLQLSPNPAGTSTELRLRQVPAGTVQVVLYTLQGQPVRQWQLTSAGPELRTRLDMSILAAGVYVVRVAGPGYHTTQRLVVH